MNMMSTKKEREISSSAIREDTDSTSNPTWPYNRLFSHGLNKYISLECSRRTTLFPTPSPVSVNSLACLDADPSLIRQFIEVGGWLGDPFLLLLFEPGRGSWRDIEVWLVVVLSPPPKKKKSKLCKRIQQRYKK